MKKSNGFTLVEVLIASSILMMIVSTIIPIISVITNERNVLSDRRILAYRLHDEMQPFLWNDNTIVPTSYTETLQFKTVSFTFSMESEFLKGCVEWQNVKKINESFCLYGIPQK